MGVNQGNAITKDRTAVHHNLNRNGPLKIVVNFLEFTFRDMSWLQTTLDLTPQRKHFLGCPRFGWDFLLAVMAIRGTTFTILMMCTNIDSTSFRRRKRRGNEWRCTASANQIYCWGHERVGTSHNLVIGHQSGARNVLTCLPFIIVLQCVITKLLPIFVRHLR